MIKRKRLKATGKTVKWKEANASFTLYAPDRKNPDKLVLTLCLTVKGIDNGNYSTWDWRNLWSKTKMRVRKMYREIVDPKEGIWVLQYPEFAGEFLHRKSVNNKSGKNFLVVSAVVENRHGDDWPDSYREPLERFARVLDHEVMDNYY